MLNQNPDGPTMLVACTPKGDSFGEVRIVLENGLIGTAANQNDEEALALVGAAIAVIALVLAWRATRPVERPMMRLSVDLGPEGVTDARTTFLLNCFDEPKRRMP